MDVIDRLAEQDLRYKPEAFYYIARAIESAHEGIQRSESRRRHISGAELIDEIIRLASKEFGYLAWAVFQEWGIQRTLDMGEIVFLMVNNDILSAQKSDSIEDFREVCDLKSVLERDYNAYDLG